jgi:hypothetical protein
MKGLEDTMMRELVVMAGLSGQHKCEGCGALLEAWSRVSDPVTGEILDQGKWSCAPCGVPGATVANVAEAAS